MNDAPAQDRQSATERWSPELVRIIERGLAGAVDVLGGRDPAEQPADQPLCAACRRPIRESYVRDGELAYHPVCFDTSPIGRCRICGASLRAGYLHNHRGERVCPRHDGALVWCRFCRRLALTDGHPPPLPPGLDAREGPVCTGCAGSAVATNAAARRLVAEVAAWLPSQGLILAVHLRPRVRLADEATIEDHRPAEGPDTYGRLFINVWSEADRRVRAHPYQILLLQGLPAALLQSVAAHELGHAWLAATGALELSPPEEEGFCELLAHRWLTSRGTPEAADHAGDIERQPDPIYGDGFRRLAAVATAVGWTALVHSLRETGRVPPP